MTLGVSRVRRSGRLALLVASMRAGGARVRAGDLLAAHRALSSVDPADGTSVYSALRASLCTRRGDLPLFDVAFHDWFASTVSSNVELLMEKDFASLTEVERRAAIELMPRSAGPDARQLSRRPRSAPRRGACERERPRPLLFVFDASGSMEPYARMLLQYVHARVAPRRRVEKLAIGGGLGADGRRARPGATVVLLWDGSDRGEPEPARLCRDAHSVIWLNPLPALGMRTALPHVDHFLPGNSLRCLEQLAVLLEGGIESAQAGNAGG
jgi:uncharacterized protein with von Willebrand factor type A (vWA) domain